MPHDQYSSCPTDANSRYPSSSPGTVSRSVLIATSTAYPLRSAQCRNARSQFHQPAPPLQTDRPSGSAHSKNHSASRSGSGCIFRRCGSGFTRNPGAIGRRIETRVPPVYNEGPPQSLYASYVEVESTSTIGALGRWPARTTKKASARSSPAATVTA